MSNYSETALPSKLLPQSQSLQLSTSTSTNFTIANSIQIIPDKLYWYCNKTPPKNVSDSFFFSIDEVFIHLFKHLQVLIYQGYNQDFGPLTLAQVHRYCSELNRIINDQKYQGIKVFHHCDPQFNKKANACFLMCAYLIICQGYSPEEAYQPFCHMEFVAFRDAGQDQCDYECTVIDCLKGLEKAIKLGWYDFKTFKYREYEHNHKLANGDMNWIVPKRILALSSPTQNIKDGLPPEHFIDKFKKMRIKAIIRLNEQLYNEDLFRQNSIDVINLEFMDGSCPSDSLIKQFIIICDNYINKGYAVAVHCRAGLGRTGTLIGCYIMNKYGFEPRALIGWLRLARPGSVIGVQQYFMNDSYHRVRLLTTTQITHAKVLSLMDVQEQKRSNCKLNENLRIKSQRGSSTVKSIVQDQRVLQSSQNIAIFQGQLQQPQMLISPKKANFQLVENRILTINSEGKISQKQDKKKSTQGEQLMERRRLISQYMAMFGDMEVQDKRF